jgi:hypothetical protein
MDEDYHIDLSKITLDDLLKTLTTGYVLPSRQILKEDIDHRFDVLRSMGINDLEVLLSELKTKQKVEKFSKRSGLPLDYLTILRREINSYRSKPISLAKIPGVDDEVIEILASAGIKNSQKMYERGRTRSDRADLVRETGLSENVIIDMVKMSDLSRIMGVGPVFTRTFLNSEIDTVEKVSTSNPHILYDRMVELYKEQGFEKVDFVLRDIEWCIDMAQRLPKSIEW